MLVEDNLGSSAVH